LTKQPSTEKICVNHNWMQTFRYLLIGSTCGVS
jgi:hypothetical protein